MRRTLLPFFIGLLFAGTITCYAHHSFPATYDLSKEVQLDGRIVALLLRNPHPFLHIATANPAGQVERWALELRGPGRSDRVIELTQRLRVGDEVVIMISPSWTASEYRGRLKSIRRKSDGFAWKEQPN